MRGPQTNGCSLWLGDPRPSGTLDIVHPLAMPLVPDKNKRNRDVTEAEQVVTETKRSRSITNDLLSKVRERNVLFNDALNTLYLRLYGVRHMVTDNSDNERGNPLP